MLVMTRLVSQNPIKATLLILSEPRLIIFTNASKEGIGGAIYRLDKSIKPLVFRFLHTDEIKQAITS